MKPTHHEKRTSTTVSESERWEGHIERTEKIVSKYFKDKGWVVDGEKDHHLELKSYIVAQLMPVVWDAMQFYEKQVVLTGSEWSYEEEANVVAARLWLRVRSEAGKEFKHRNDERSNRSDRSKVWSCNTPLPRKKDADRGKVKHEGAVTNPARLLIQERIRHEIADRERERGRPLDEFERFEIELDFDRFDFMLWLQGQHGKRMPNTKVAAYMRAHNIRTDKMRNDGRHVDDRIIRDWLTLIGEWGLIERTKARQVERERLVRFRADATISDDPIFDRNARQLFEWDDHHELCAQFTHHELESALAEWAEDAIRCELMLDELEALRN